MHRGRGHQVSCAGSGSDGITPIARPTDRELETDRFRTMILGGGHLVVGGGES